MKLNSKILFTLFLFFIILLFFSFNNVFASINFTYNNEVILLPDIPSTIDVSNGYFIGFYNNKYFIWVLNNDSSYFYKRSSSSPQIWVSGSASAYDLVGNSWVYNNDTQTNYCVTNIDCFRCTYVDIYLGIGKTEVFINPVQGVVIPALETAEQVPEAMGTTLKILIPVGLVVLAIGLIIYLIKRVIYSVQ